MSEPEPIDPKTIDWDRELARSPAPAVANRECPWCKAMIPAGARACRYCGKRSDPAPGSPEAQADAAKSSADTKKGWLGCLGMIVLIVLLASMCSKSKPTWSDFDEGRLKEAQEDYVYAITRDRPPDEIREKKSWLDFLKGKKREAGK